MSARYVAFRSDQRHGVDGLCLLAALLCAGAVLSTTEPVRAAGPLGAEPVGAEPVGNGAEELSFDELVRLNKDEIFGGEVSLGDKSGGELVRVTLTYTKGGFETDFPPRRGARAFVSRAGEVLNESVKRSLLAGADGKFSFLGRGSGVGLSRFPLEDVRISFKLRAPNLEGGARLGWFLQSSNAGMFRADLFPYVMLADQGQHRRQLPAQRRFRAAPVHWFDHQSKGVPVEIIIGKGKAAVRLGAGEEDKEGLTEVVTLEDISDLGRAHLGLSFSNLSFLVTDLKIKGKIFRGWLEEEIERLRRAGKLRTEKPRSEKEELPPKKSRKEKEGPDLDKPDPEADVEL